MMFQFEIDRVFTMNSSDWQRPGIGGKAPNVGNTRRRGESALRVDSGRKFEDENGLARLLYDLEDLDL